MIVYRIVLPTDVYECREISIRNLKSAGIKNVEYDSACKPDDSAVDFSYHKTKYGFPLSEQELKNYFVHYEIWMEFLQTEEDCCLVIESNVELKVNLEELIESITDFPEDMDVFIPYDREKYINEEPNLSLALLNPNQIEARNVDSYSRGCKWGNSIYLLSKSGATKLIKENIIKDRLDNTFIELAHNDRLNLYYDDVSWLRQSSIDWREWPERYAVMWNYILEITPWTEERKQTAKKLLNIVSRIALELDIKPILQGGSHLGYIQHEGIMLWDDDIDIGIQEHEVPVFIQALQKNKEIKFDKYIEWSTNTEYYKIWFIAGEPIDGHRHTFPFIDVWLYRIDYPDFVFKNGIICPNSAKYEVEPILFEDSLYYITGNSLEVLDSRYTHWRSEIIVYPYSHRLEKRSFPMLRIKIETDEKGKMVGPLSGCRKTRESSI